MKHEIGAVVYDIGLNSKCEKVVTKGVIVEYLDDGRPVVKSGRIEVICGVNDVFYNTRKECLAAINAGK